MIEDRNVSINIPEGVPFTSSHFIDGNIHFNVNYNAEFPLLWTQLQPYNLTGFCRSPQKSTESYKR